MQSGYDVIVVGAGSMGMSAGYYLARRGLKTLMIDAFDPPHEQGSHHGETRLIRHAYSGDALYSAWALRADVLWQELEALTGEQLLLRCGVLHLSVTGEAALVEKALRAKQHYIPYEVINAEAISRKWPGICAADTMRGLYEPKAGVLFSEACIRAYRRLALEAGALLLPYTKVEHIQVEKEPAKGAAVTTNNGQFFARQMVITTGAWYQTLEPFVKLPIRPVRKVIGWFEVDNKLYGSDCFPGFTMSTASGDYYSVPDINGKGLKIGRHDGGLPWQANAPLPPFGDHAEDEGDIRHLLETYMPKAAGRLLLGAVCKYELTPDEHFIIDRHPVYDNVWLAGGFSGHGFKFASVVGETLADLVEKGQTEWKLDRFQLARFHQQQEQIAYSD
ncbi:N-methyl-L-tryptophan oxidase [Paenibacillus sp. UMB4589-SE434]|uniref:N-methyl-L-tryptophan oxidase n=1 Tax=Paenibacillus sp. UMB4589-SE434 TaxID=3046314 RepID=UPI00254EB0D2|nr:N-methyl-L-tryptophan oxidase [Paenibacillus sp. UMB4589-SE434]MDK8180597.1 N-methyl-L-tryptophan oxidase [Paenibacillus sp. UMB4589-SE434]